MLDTDIGIAVVSVVAVFVPEKGLPAGKQCTRVVYKARA